MSLATFITNAVIKVSTDEAYANMPFATREEARAQFVAALLFELGLGPAPVAVHAPAQEPKEEKKEASEPAQASKKPRAPKKAKAEEPKVEEAGQLAIAETKPAEDVKVVELKEATKEKKPRKPKAKAEEKPAEVAAAEPPVANAGAEPVKEKKKPGPKPKAKPEAEGPVNIDKLTPTHKKHLKKIAEELKVELNDKEFLAYANGMSAEEWGAKALDEHIRAFLAPEPIPLAAPPKEFVEVEFKDKTYLVDPETKFVYEMVAEGASVRNRLGTVGLLEFKDMEFSTDNSTE